MIDIAALRGSTVRDNAGTRGEILSVSLPWVRVGWWDEGAVVSRKESFLRSDPRIAGMEILTINEGWIPASRLVGVDVPAEVEMDTTLAEDLSNLIQEKKRSPFKRASKIGRSVAHGRWKKKKDYWDCSGKNYRYVCKGKEGEKKIITRDKDAKSAYNKAYKKYQALNRLKSQSFTKIVLPARKAAKKAKKNKKK
jgi:hypothetical protein